jgi:dienelactone hydrolase
MTRLSRRAACIVLLVIAASGGLPQHALSAPKETLGEGGQGNIEFRTLTLTRDQFLAGSKVGKEAVISGRLSFPKTDGKVPAVIISHGGDGISKSETGWADELGSMGVATFLVDSYSGRGINRNPSEGELSRTGQVLDLYRALALLATHPRIDSKRIALMGCSRGGGEAIYASLAHFRKPQFPPDVDIAAYLALYPALPANFDFARWELQRRPVRIFQGGADDATPLAIAKAVVEAQRAKGIDVRMFEYPFAHHAFDNPDISAPVAHRVGTIGYNGQAADQAVKDMRETLREIFGLK